MSEGDTATGSVNSDPTMAFIDEILAIKPEEVVRDWVKMFFLQVIVSDIKAAGPKAEEAYMSGQVNDLMKTYGTYDQVTEMMLGLNFIWLMFDLVLIAVTGATISLLFVMYFIDTWTPI